MSEDNKDVHTEHCCLNCGCKYGEDVEIEMPFENESFIGCSVASKDKKQTNPCNGDCFGR